MSRVSSLLLLAVTLPACADRGPATADLAITHVTVVDVTDGGLSVDRTIFVEGNRITSILPTSRAKVPREAKTVDASGQFAIPGLWDMHVHTATTAEWTLPLLLAHGVTGVRNMHTTVDTALELVSAIKRRLASGELDGPRFIANGPILDGYPPAWPGAVVARNPGEGRAAVDSLAEAGADFIKVYDALSQETFLAIADEAHRRGIPVDGHMPVRVPPDVGAAAGMRTVEHTSGITAGCSAKADSLRAEYTALLERMPTLPFPASMFSFFRLVRGFSDTRDPALCARTVAAYRAAGVAVTPTLVVNATWHLDEDPDRARLVPVSVWEEWQGMAGSGIDSVMTAILGPTAANGAANLRLLNEAGVTILAGTDVGNPYLIPGLSLHEELGQLVDAGLSPLEALRTATLNPALVLGYADSLGTLVEGMVADIVLLRGNPLADIHNTNSVDAVVLDGRYLDRAALNRLLDISRLSDRRGR